MIVEGRDVIAVPMAYHDEFKRDPQDSLLKYGSLPQRARQPWFTNTDAINRALVLPDLIVGPRAERQLVQTAGQVIEYSAMIGSSDPEGLLSAISPHFYAADDGYWHVHVDLALNKKRHGDAAGIAMGRIAATMSERSADALGNPYERIVNAYEIPLVGQVLAPPGDQVYISALTRLILQLKLMRGFNITSFSFDGFQSAEPIQQLTLAGLVTAGQHVDKDTGIVTGIGKPFSVDRSPQPYRELLETINDDRTRIANYTLLRRELRELETVGPGLAPDHPWTGSKDTSDPCAGVVGFLAAFGHAVLDDTPLQVDRGDLAAHYGLSDSQDFTVEEDSSVDFDLEPSGVSFSID